MPRKKITIDLLRLEAANAALRTFSSSQIQPHYNIHSDRFTGFVVSWPVDSWPSGCTTISKRWQCRNGQDFYPVWSRHYPGGGTSCTALSQLIRWLRDQPVLPISAWRHWASDRVKLLPLSAVDALLTAGYPASTPCVLCGTPLGINIKGSLDWWHLNTISGPCCSWTTGCRQTGKLISATAASQKSLPALP